MSVISELFSLCDQVLADNPVVGECEGWLAWGNSPTNEDGYECPRSGKLRRNGQVLCDQCYDNTPMEFRR